MYACTQIKIIKTKKRREEKSKINIFARYSAWALAVVAVTPIVEIKTGLKINARYVGCVADASASRSIEIYEFIIRKLIHNPAVMQRVPISFETLTLETVAIYLITRVYLIWNRFGVGLAVPRLKAINGDANKEMKIKDAPMDSESHRIEIKLNKMWQNFSIKCVK